jgi:asparaginyl-tRNA synthetase
MAFCDLNGDMDLAEEFIKHLTTHVVRECREDLDLFARFVDKKLLHTLQKVQSAPFSRVPYREAVEALQKSKKKFEFSVEFGKDLQAEHERYLTEEYYQNPVIIYNYPKSIKPFYMRINDDDPHTVAAMDVLLPGIGEIIGGSQREERLEVIEGRMEELGMSKEEYWWYLDSRIYGSVPHSGFGLGLERLLMWMTGIKNIRDVIPFPRTPSQIDF